MLDVTVSGASNNPATVYVYYPYDTYSGHTVTTFGPLTRVGSTYRYTKTYQFISNNYVPGRLVGSTWQTRRFYTQATTQSGETATKITGAYIAAKSRSFYTSIDSTFYYTNNESNSIWGVGTPEYNCLSFVIGLNNVWTWPWSQNPTQTQLYNFMTKEGAYRPIQEMILSYSSAQNFDVIYYSDNIWGVGNDGHFAKVCAWDSNGNPTRIISKWGSLELIYSQDDDPFIGTYGSPKAYFKKIS